VLGLDYKREIKPAVCDNASIVSFVHSARVITMFTIARDWAQEERGKGKKKNSALVCSLFSKSGYLIK